MAEREQGAFLPETVDEQVDAYLLTEPSGKKVRPETPQQEMMQALQQHFAPTEQDNATLQRVKQRFEQRRRDFSAQKAPIPIDIQMRRSLVKDKALPKEGGWARRLSLVAATIVIVVLVGSMLVLFRHAPGQRSTATSTSSPSQEEKFFAWSNYVLYRLDVKTHKLLWQFPAHSQYGLGKLVKDTYYITDDVNSAKDGEKGVTLQKTLYALNAVTGKVRWKVTLDPNESLAVPLITEEHIYLSLLKGGYPTVRALDTASGAQQWEQRVGKEAAKNNNPFLAPVLNLFASSTQAVYGEFTPHRDGKSTSQRFALDARTGKSFWVKNEEIAQLYGVDKGFVVDGVLTVAKEGEDLAQNTSKQYLLGYDAKDGKELWRRPLATRLSFYGTTPLNGIIYLNTNGQPGKGNEIYAFAAKTGTSVWHYQDASSSGSSYPTVTEKGIYINRYIGQELVAIDTMTGKMRWTYKFQDPITVEYPPAAANEYVYLSLPDNVVQVLRASDGKSLETFKIPGKVDPNNRPQLQVVS